MALISKDIFLKIADRLASQYAALVATQKAINVSGGYAEITLNPAGANNALVFRAVKKGSEGNKISVRYVNPGTNSHSFLSTLTRTLKSNEIQKVIIEGAPTGGTWRLTFKGETTLAISYNASASEVQTKLENLANIAPGDIEVTGGPGPSSAYLVEFKGTYALLDVPSMTASYSLTGGANARVRVEENYNKPTTDEVNIVFNLATNASAVITTTAQDIINDILENNNNHIEDWVQVANSGTDDGTGTVTGMPKTFLTGGLSGLYQDIIMESQDDDVIGQLDSESQNLDTYFTADKMALGVTDLSLMMTGLRTHMTSFGVDGLITTFCEDNDIRVHEYFNTLHNAAVGTPLGGKVVFKATQKEVAVIDLSANVNKANLVVAPVAGVKASVTINPAGSDNTIKWTAVTAGKAGNAITVQYLDPAAASQTLYIEVQGKNIVVHLATNGSGSITTTASQIITAVAAHTAASALVTATAVGTTTGVVTAIAQTWLTLVNNQLRFTAVETGSEGNEVSICYVNPGLPSQSLGLSVSGKAINVLLATDISGNITSTAQEIKDVVELDPNCIALVTVSAAGSGNITGVVAGYSQTYLQGGVTPSITSNNPLGTGSGDADIDTNMAAATLNVYAKPASKASSLTLDLGTSAYAQIDIDTTGSNNGIRIKADAPGNGGNSITITFLYVQKPNLSESVLVSGNNISVTLGTNSSSDITSTANSVVSLINSDTNASALVTAANLPGSSGIGLIGSAFSTQNLTNTKQKITYTAVTEGASGDNIRVRYIDPGVPLEPLAISVAGSDITVTLKTGSGAELLTTAADLIAAINQDVSASALVTATDPIDGSTDGSGPSKGLLGPIGYRNLNGGGGPGLRRDTSLRLTLLNTNLVSTTRDISFFAGDVEGTSVTIPAQSASYKTGLTVSNNAILWTATTPGTNGNLITIRLKDPGSARATLSVTVTGSAITVNLATDHGGRIVSTADEVVNAIQASGSASTLVTASVQGNGYAYVTPVNTTYLTGGEDQDRFYEVESVAVLSGGEVGDRFKVKNVLERSISL